MLTKTGVEGLKPQAKPYKKADEKGLYVLVTPDGQKLWRFKYRWNSSEKLLSLGKWPDTTLSDARDKRDTMRAQLAKGQDPSAVRKAEKANNANTFRTVADEWLAKQAHWTDGTRTRNTRVLKDLVKQLKGKADEGMATISAPDLLDGLRRLEDRPETARRAARMAAAVCHYAIVTGRAKFNAAVKLSTALTEAKTKHRPAITNAKRFGQMLVAIDGYDGQPTTKAALQLIALTFVRPGELRHAMWSEFDLKNAMWVIPAAHMKSRREHLVPLSTQVLAVLEGLHPLTFKKPDSLVFPSLRPGRPQSDNTMAAALRTLGIPSDQHVPHGFRSSASTLLHEAGYDSQVIELQLAHLDTNKTRAVYNRSEKLAERKVLMQAWGDLCQKMAKESHE